MIEMKKLKSSLFIVVLQHRFLVVPFKGIKALSWSQKRCIRRQHLKWAFTGRSYVIQGQLRDYVRHSRLVTYIDIFLYLTYIKDTCVIYMKCVNLFLHIYTSSYIDSLFQRFRMSNVSYCSCKIQKLF